MGYMQIPQGQHQNHPLISKNSKNPPGKSAKKSKNFSHSSTLIIQMQYYPKTKIYTQKKVLDSGPTLPLGELGNCLRPPSGRGPQNFRKEPGSRGKEKKKLVSNELQK